MPNVANPLTHAMYSYANYQVIPPKANQAWTRYFPLAGLRKNLGIDWSKSGDFTYYGQLAASTNPSFTIRSNFLENMTLNTVYTTCQLTYYYEFRNPHNQSL